MHFTTKIESNDDEVTCRSNSNYLMERVDTSSDSCSDAKATLGESCCYSICDMCENMITTGMSLSTLKARTYCVVTSMSFFARSPWWMARNNVMQSRVIISIRAATRVQRRHVSCASRVIYYLISMTMWK
mmetsp:Transcript_17504/g.31797  ORF Transcript_17504/g.31797 Transcript_17504/m.31797 type:complete len:130 (+) Transcript_17504:2584-2973(+)